MAELKKAWKEATRLGGVGCFLCFVFLKREGNRMDEWMGSVVGVWSLCLCWVYGFLLFGMNYSRPAYMVGRGSHGGLGWSL